MRDHCCGCDEERRPTNRCSVDGQPHAARAGDTLLAAALTRSARVRKFELGDGFVRLFSNAVCQDCWVKAKDVRVRACSILVAGNMFMLFATHCDT
ncbi:2Fe-2S iron-sulfur cluster-binding protein [Mesorhizobium sp. M0437]|uniref:2Fe-2S iron-sulfur cluster-binding protein n=1 Tax=Mesorhizobium sp. M0437 TaxID=2956945 RepID=UPI00333CD6F4